MTKEVKSLEEMPGALSYLIAKVENLEETVQSLRYKQQASNLPHWMDIDELCSYVPSHPVKQTVYGWVSNKQIPYHKINKASACLQSEIDDWMKQSHCKSQNDLEQDAQEYIRRHKAV